MRCIENIKDIALDCRYRPTKGLKHRVLVIPYKDIDRRYTTMNDDKSVITHFQLYPTKRGYLFELSNAFKLNGSQKLSGGFVHELSIKINKANSDNIATMNALTKGTYVLVVETMSNTFEILGYDAGVVVSSIQRDYAGNVIGLTFATPSDVKELRMVALWGEGDYIAMSKKFENKALVRYNLLKCTKDFELKEELYYLQQNYAGNAGIVSENFRGNKVYKLIYNWQGFQCKYLFMPRPTIISFWAKTTKSDIAFACFTDNSNAIYPYGTNIISDGQWHRYTIFGKKGITTFSVGNYGFVEFYNKTQKKHIEELYVSSFKIEYAELETDWADWDGSELGKNLITDSKNERYKEYKGTAEEYIYYGIVGGTLEKNTTYTLSLEYKSENVRSIDLFFINEDFSQTPNKNIPNTNGEWKREIFTFTTKSNLSPKGSIRIDNNGSDTGNVTSKLWTRNVKLEKGNIATDWSE